MKKITSIFVALFILLFATQALAVWTISASVDRNHAWLAQGGYQRVIRVKVSFVSDGADPSEFNLSTYLTAAELNLIKSGLFYAVKTDGDDSAHPDAYTVTFDCEHGADLLSVTTTETGGKAEWFSATDHSLNFHIWDLQVDFGDVGANLDAGDLYIYIVK